jgi:RNA polymerase sigma-70 factor (ECF subfamily)
MIARSTMVEQISNETFDGLRRYLFAVAYRMTGSAGEAEDLVQDSWIRYLDAGSPAVASLRAYLTTIVSRLSLDYLKSARVRRETYVGEWLPEPVLTSEAMPGPAETLEQREEVSIAFLTLLEQLSPEQRVVYVLREGFGLPFEDIGIHAGRTAAACRQLYRRAQKALPERLPQTTAAIDTHRDLIERFLSALEQGNVESVTRLLSEDVVLIGDGGPNRLASRRPIIGRDRVVRGLLGYKALPSLATATSWTIEFLNGSPAVVNYVDGVIDRVTFVDIVDEQVVAIRGVLNPDKLVHLRRSLEARIDS